MSSSVRIAGVILSFLVCGLIQAQTGPSLTLDPPAGPPKSMVTATGDGFDEMSCGVNLYLDSTDGVLLGKADLEQGAFSIKFVVPDDAEVGEQTILAVGLDSVDDSCEEPTGEEASAIFTVEEPGAMLSLEPPAGPARSIVIVRGELFETTSCGVDLFLDSPSGAFLGSATLTDGVFVREIEIPDGTDEGEHQIVALGLAETDEDCSMMTGEDALSVFAVEPGNFGPFVSDPVTPFVQELDLGGSPELAAWRSGDPVQIGPGETLDRDAPPVVADPAAAPAASDFRARRMGEKARTRDGIPQFERMTRDEPIRQMLRSTMMAHAKGEPRLNFDGIPATGVIPPSSGGDVGLDHFIQTVNAAFAIYDKDGALLAGPTGLGELWAGTDSVCETSNDGDPDVRYDAPADRWIISSIVADDTQCLAVSRGADPVSGGWFLYAFPTGAVMNDYPRLAVWPGAYFVGTQRAYPTGGSDAWAFDRAAMLEGKPAVAIRFYDPGWFTLPADVDGEDVPDDGTPGIFLRQVDGAQIGGEDRLEMMEFAANFVTPTDSTFTATPDLATEAFDRDMCGFDLNTPCVVQPDDAPVLDAFTALAMARLQFRIFEDHQSLVLNHTVDADGMDHAGVRWYELRRSSGAWSIYQQGTYAPDGGESGLADDPQRWMAGAAMDKNQNIALGYSVSGEDDDPGIRYAGRYADDPQNTMPREEMTLVEGGGTQSDPSGRWGEFSSMTVDPLDDCTFWYTSEYYASASEAGWSTRIGTFQLDEIAPEITCPDDVTVECSVTDGTPADDMQLESFFEDASATDDCSLETLITDDAPNLLLLGQTDVEFTATDTETNSSECTAIVTVEDTTIPDVIAPADVIDFECTSPDGATPEIGMPAVSDVCDDEPVVVNDAPPIFPIGTTSVTWTATDESDNVGADTQSVEIVDTTPPELSVAAGPNVLWPPNHKMIDIHIAVVVDDVCDTTLDLELVSIESNEAPNGNGDGNTKPDFDSAEFGTDDRHFRLRAERKGNADGRVYTIVYRATDDSGNAALATTTVSVPHDQGGAN